MSKRNYIYFHSKFKLLLFIKIERHLGGIQWPIGIAYSVWQKLLRKYLCELKKSHRASKRRKKLKKKWSRESKVRISQQIIQNQKAIDNQLKTAIKTLETVEPNVLESINKEEVKLELITILKQFLERRNVSEIIGKVISDHRNQDLIKYSKQSIIMATLAIFLFRMGSGNKYDGKSHDDDERYSQANIARFIDAPKGHAPVIKTIELFLRSLNNESINELMISFFKDLRQSKFFMQHPQLMLGDFFLLAADGVHTHTYDHPHHTDSEGNNDCDCCCKRVYNKETEKEKTRWVHNTLVFCFVFMGGLKIPVYQYPIHSKQIVNLESASEEMHKQECELVALKMALPVIRKAFPRMKIVLLLDGLYANRPVIRLANEQGCGYIIVRKEGNLLTLERDCDGYVDTPNHKKNCVKTIRRCVDGWSIIQRYEWFNKMYLGHELSTNVLRFSEKRTKEGKEEQTYKSEWLFSWLISAKNCELSAFQARSRWEIEDMFNTMKNRGFKIKHDYSRHPNSCFNWQGLALFAFGIFELFRFSEVIKQRSDLPLITLVEKLQAQLTQRPTEEIFSETVLQKRIQFRYNFPVNQITVGKFSDDGGDKRLEAA